VIFLFVMIASKAAWLHGVAATFLAPEGCLAAEEPHREMRMLHRPDIRQRSEGAHLLETLL
jgi:hypothetical protein